MKYKANIILSFICIFGVNTQILAQKVSQQAEINEIVSENTTLMCNDSIALTGVTVINGGKLTVVAEKGVSIHYPFMVLVGGQVNINGAPVVYRYTYDNNGNRISRK